MGEMSANERVVAVFGDRESAEAAAQAAREAGAGDVRIGNSSDEVAALRAEMREEGAEAWAGPSFGLYTREMARSVPLWTVAAAAIGAVVALPLAFLFDAQALSLRLVIAAAAGAVTGGTIGFIVGGGFFGPRRKAFAPMAAERGVVVGATETTGGVARDLSRHGPVRVDRVSKEGQPERTVATENDRDRRH